MKLKNIIGSMASKFAALALALTCAGNVWGAETTTIKNAAGEDITVYVVTEGFYQDGENYDKAKNFYITNLTGLKYFRDWVNGTSAAMNHYYDSGFLTLTLASFATNNGMSGKNVHLLADIDLTGEVWQPIGPNSGSVPDEFDGNWKAHFYGSFYGHGHVVSNMDTSKSDQGYKYSHWPQGFFGSIASGGPIDGLILENVKSVSNFNDGYAGGIVGNLGTVPYTISNCEVRGKIEIDGGYSGAICGIGNANIVNCVVSGDDGSTISGSQFAGGLVGAERCSATSNLNITGNTISGVAVSSSQFVGSIVGAMASGSAGVCSITENDVVDCVIGGNDATLETLIDENDAANATVTVANNTVRTTLIVETGDLTPEEEITPTTKEVNYTVPVTVRDRSGNVVSETTAQEIAVSVADADIANTTLASVKIGDVVAKAIESVGEDATSVTAIEIQVKKSTPGEAAQSVTYEVHPEAVVTVSKTGEAATSSTVELSNSDLAANATFTFELDVTSLDLSEGDKVKVTHSWDAYTDASGNAVAAGSETTLAAVLEGKKVRITTTHFSTWTLEGITIQDDAVAIVFGEGGSATQYTSIMEAINAAYNGGTVELLADVTVDHWHQNIWTLVDGVGDWNTSPRVREPTVGPNGLTIDGNGHILTVNSIDSAGNGVPGMDGNLFSGARNVTIKDITINAGNKVDGIGMVSGTIAGVTFNMSDGRAVYTGGINNYESGEHIEIRNCTFGSNSSNVYAIYNNALDGDGVEALAAGAIISGCTFNTPRSVILRSDEQFLNNTVKGVKGVTVAEGSRAVIRGNYFADTTTSRSINVYPSNATIENNVILGPIELEDKTYETAPDLSGNYWGGGAPENLPEGVVIDSYYTTYSPAQDGSLFVLSNIYEVPYVASVTKSGVTTKYTDLREALEAGKAAGSVVTLLADVDLNNEPWTPISGFAGTFDGDNHKISNLYINLPDQDNVGLFDSGNGIFRNFTIVNANVTGKESVAAVFGRTGGAGFLAENVSVTGRICIQTSMTSGYGRVGGIAGGWVYGRFISCSVIGDGAETSFIKSCNRYAGGIVGHADDVQEYTNCTVKNIKLSAKWLCGGIAGPGPAYSTTTGCKVENVVIDAYASGGLFGWIFTGSTQNDETKGVIDTCSVSDVAFTSDDRNGGIGGYSISGSDAKGVIVKNISVSNVANATDDSALLTYNTTIVRNQDGSEDVYYYATPQIAVDNLMSDDEVVTVLNYTEGMVAPEGWDFKTENNVTTLVRAVAQVGDQKFETLAAAVEAVPENGAEATTIKMIADVELDATVTIPANKNVVLDLNGKTVSGAISGAPVIRNNGTLAIADSGNAGTIANTLVDSTTSVKLSGAVNNYGTLTLNGGRYSTSVGGSYVVYTGAGTGAGATTTVNNCTVRGGAMKGVFQTAGGTLVVNDADVDVSCKYYVFDVRGDGGTPATGGSATVNGGSFKLTHANGQQMLNFAMDEGGDNTLTINGGDFTFVNTSEATKELIVFNDIDNADGTYAFKIAGGTFTGPSENWNLLWLHNKTVETFGAKGGSVVISGGNFYTNPQNETSEYNWPARGVKLADGYSYSGPLTDDNNKIYYTVISDYEAQIVRGGAVKQKGTLAEMIAAATSGDTIQLLKDIVVTAQIVIPKSLTLDGNGHTIATTADLAVNVNNVDDGEVTIKNLTITAGSGTKRFVNVEESANLKLNLAGCTMTGCTYYAVNVRGSNSNIALNITDCNISGYCALNIWGAGGTVNVSGGTLGGVNSYSYAPGHNGNDFGVIVLNASTAPYEVTIAGTTLSAASVADSQNRKNREDIVLFNPNAANYTVRLDGCKIERSDDPSLQGLFKEEDGTSNNLLYANNTVDKTTSTTAVLPAGYAYMPADENGWMLVAEAVASVTTGGTGAGTTYYATLAAAIDAAQDGDTVQLLKDVTVSEEIDIADGRSITLDLNGKNVALNNGNIGILHGGLAVAGTGTIGGTSKGYKSIYLKGSTNPADANYSTLSIGENVTVTSENGYAVMVSANGTSAYGVVIDVNGTVQGHYGALYTNGTIQQHDGENVAKVNVNSTAKISSPEVDVAAVYAAGYAEWMFADGCEVSGGTAVFAKGGNIVVNGGKFTANGAASEFVHGNNGCEITGEAFVIESAFGYAPVSVEVKGGTFNSVNANAVGSYAYGDGYAPVDGFISGGDFTSAVPEEFCATGFIPKTETTVIDGVTYYTVKEGQYVAQIVETGKKYETLAKAITAATAEQTVQMIADVVGQSTVEVAAGKNVTLDLYGHSIEAAMSDPNRHYYVFDNYGTLTLKDTGNGSPAGSIAGRGLRNNLGATMTVYGGVVTALDSNGGAGILNRGAVTFYGGTMQTNVKGNNAFANSGAQSSVVVNDGRFIVTYAGNSSDNTGPCALINLGGTATIKKCYIESASERSYALHNTGDITIDPATDDDVTVKGAHGGLAINAGTATVNGGTFTCTGSYACWITNDGNNTSVTINGGVFSGNGGGVFAAVDDGAQDASDVAVIINGGYFNTTVKGSKETSKQWTIALSGGFYQTAPADVLLAFGYEVVPNTDEATKGVYPWTVAHKAGYIVEKDNGEGYAVIPVDSDWIDDNVPEVGDTATTEEIEDALNKPYGNTNLKKWQAYVLNQTESIKVTEIDNTDALKTTLGNAKTGTGLDVSYSLVKVNSATGAETDEKPSAEKTFALKKAKDGSLETGLYKVRVHFKPTGDTSASEVTVDSTNTVGVLKVEPKAEAKFVVLAVPFKELGGNATDPVKVSSYIRSGLADGDVLHVYNGDNYDTWTYNGSSWDKATNVTKTDENTESISEPAPATTATLARGTAVILRRATGNTAPLVFVGDYTGAAEQDIDQGWNLVASPSIEDFDPATKFTSGKIQIPTGGIPLNYTYSPRTKKWGYTTSINNTPTRVEDPIPAGTGFWYISDGDKKVTW